MATKRLQDIPIKPPRIAQNRDDPREGEGPFVGTVSSRVDAELVTPNGLVWNNVHEGIVETEPSTNRFPRDDFRRQGNRAVLGSQGGNTTVNYPSVPAIRHGGNNSGR